MASILYRLGRAAARHTWAFIGLWLVLLLAVGGSAAAFKGPFVNQFSLPQSESYQTLQRLKEQIPAAAGGHGSIALISETPFTAEQKSAVKTVVANLKAKNHVDTVQDPIASQDEIDSGRKKIEEFPQKQKDAQAKIDKGRADLGTAQKQLDAGKAQLDPVLKQVAALRAAGMEDQAAGIEAQLAPKVAEAKAAQAKIDAARKQLDDAQKKLDDGAADVARAKKQLDSAKGVRLVSEDGKTALISLGFDTQAEALSEEDRKAILDEVKTLNDKGIQTEFSKEVIGETPSLAGPGEIIGVIVAAILLFVMLGTLVAAGLPLINALLGVAIGIGGTVALSSVFEFSTTALTLGSMLGLAVGIDYSLFIINRYRSNRMRGDERIEAIALAVGTAGNAVTFAGLTVIIALAALTISGIPFLGVMGLVGAATIAVAVLVALTLTPALLSAIGDRAMPKKMRAIVEANSRPQHDGAAAAAQRARRAVDSHSEDGGSHSITRPGTEKHAQSSAAGPAGHTVRERAWGRIVTSHPWITVAASVIALGLLAIPASQLRLALPDGSQELADSTQYKAYTAVGKAFGEGANGPLLVVTDLPKGLTKEQAEDIQYKVADQLRSMKDVKAAVPGALSDNRETGVIQVIPAEGPASVSTKDLVNTLKSEQGAVKDATDATIHVTGQSAIQIDVSQTLADAMPLYLSIVVGLSLILLLLVFRSIWVPLLATGGFLLSLFATMGAVVAIYQNGFLADLFGVSTPGPILSFLPIIVVGVLFGLAMDYQMFLVSGMREAYVHGDEARKAVRTGFNHASRVVTVAALIMVSVFAGFIFSEQSIMRPMGFALAFGVLVDAFVVRLTLTPALLHLLGDKAWWIPSWLDRILPDVDVEGARLESQKHPGS